MFRSIIVSFVQVAFSFCCVALPFEDAVAAAGQFNSAWVTVPATTTQTVSVPENNWSQLSSTMFSNGTSISNSMFRGERWITFNQETAGQLGLRSDQVSSVLEKFSNTAPVIYAQYLQEKAELRIQVLQVRKTPDGHTRLYIADYTPHHGEYFKKERAFMTAAEAADPEALGHNPFQQQS